MENCCKKKKLNNDGNNFTTFFPWKWLRYAESIQPCFRIIKNSTCANLKYKRGTGHSVEIKRFSVIQILCEINFDKYTLTIFHSSNFSKLLFRILKPFLLYKKFWIEEFWNFHTVSDLPNAHFNCDTVPLIAAIQSLCREFNFACMIWSTWQRG